MACWLRRRLKLLHSKVRLAIWLVAREIHLIDRVQMIVGVVILVVEVVGGEEAIESEAVRPWRDE